MAIALRGTPTTGSAINGGDITLSMPAGLAQGDVVVVGYAMAAPATGGTSSGGWTQIGANVGASARIQIFRKVMGASPDASIVLTGSTLAADSSTAIAIAFSGVDNGNPEGGVALTSATATTTDPDPAAIPSLTGSVAIIYAGASQVDVTGTAAPAGYSNFSQTSSTDSNSTSSYLAWKASLVGGVSENPGTFTGVAITPWAAYTIVLAPELPAATSSNLSIGPNVPPAYIRKGLAAALIASGAVVGPLSPPAAAPAAANYGIHNERHHYSPAKRSVALLGQTSTWPAQRPAPPTATTTEWIFTPFSQPIRVYQHRRGEVASPPGGFSFQPAPAQTPTDLWWPRWQEPPQYSQSRPRLEGFVAWPGVGYSTVTVVAPPSEWWHERWQNPPRLQPRQQGFVSFAGTAGLPITFSPGPWAVGPVAYWAQQRNWRLAASWPWQAYSFTVPVATPSALWFPVWQERPRERRRSVYLRQGSWAGWDPQFIIQIVPPTPLEGVTFTFGIKRGASVTEGTKCGATLLTRVKPRNS